MTAAQSREYDTLTQERPRNGKQTGLTSITSRFLSLPGVRIHPTLDRVLVEYEEIAETTPSGILIPSTAQTRKSVGSYPVKVLAVGPGRWAKEATREAEYIAQTFRECLEVIRDASASYEARDLKARVETFIERLSVPDERIPMSYAPGDRAMAPCLNFPLYMDGREVYLVNEDALLGKLEP
jgi:hypothetical protein